MRMCFLNKEMKQELTRCFHAGDVSLYCFQKLGTFMFDFFQFRLAKLLMGQMVAWSVLFLMEMNMTMVRILLYVSTCSLIFLFLHIYFENPYIYILVLQYLMSTLEMVNQFVSCLTIDQVLYLSSCSPAFDMILSCYSVIFHSFSGILFYFI